MAPVLVCVQAESKPTTRVLIEKSGSVGSLRRPGVGRHTFDPLFPGIIGEFSTTTTDIWPDLPTGEQTILSRLRLARDRGYPLAIAAVERALETSLLSNGGAKTSSRHQASQNRLHCGGPHRVSLRRGMKEIVHDVAGDRPVCL